MSKNKNRIDDNQLLLAILTSGSYTQAAKILGVSKNTISRRMKNEQLKSRIVQYRKTILDTVNLRLMDGASKAVDVLIELLDSESEISRYNAASRILGLTQDFIESEDIISEIDKLKAEAEQRGRIV